jgi:hypothetical protein
MGIAEVMFRPERQWFMQYSPVLWFAQYFVGYHLSDAQ